MKQNFDAEADPLRQRDETLDGQSRGEASQAVGQHLGGNHAPDPSASFDWWVAVNLLARRWVWLLLGGLVGAAGFYFLGERLVRPKFTASAQLLRFDTTGANELFKTPLSAETFAGLIRSPDLLRHVGEQAVPPIPPEKLFKYIKIEPEPDSDMVKVLLAAGSPQQAVDLLNVYTREAVEFAKSFQKDQASRLAKDYLKEQVAKMDKDLSALHNEFRGLPAAQEGTTKSGGTNGQSSAMTRPASLQVAKLRQQLEAEYDKLNDLSRKYTDLNPLVDGERQLIKDIENQISRAATNTSLTANISWSLAAPSPTGRSSESVFNPEGDIIRMKLLSLEESRVQLANRLHETELYANNPPGLARIFAPATLKTVKDNMRGLKISFATVFGGMVGVGGSLLIILLIEVTDRRLRTADDLRRVTKLPVLTTLGDLTRMEPQERARWAFRTWTMLQGRLSRSANHGLICGLTSSQEGEGRTTWINLLAEAASLTGFRVLTIATSPPPTDFPSTEDNDEENVPQDSPMNPTMDPTMNSTMNPGSALATSVLTSPSQVTEQLTGPNSQPVVHIPLPGWVWNLERRKQWREALSQWRKIDNLVILVELPPASLTEAVLLGCNLPNIVWLADSGVPDAAETRAQLETLRNARCNLVGAVLNRCLGQSIKSRFPRWVECAALFMLFASFSLCAQNPEVAAAAPPPALAVVPPPAPVESQPAPSFSIVSPTQRAAWQQHLTLGPGDVLNLGLYGQPELTRTDVVIAPDGMVNYLDATNVLATGLTIDELRAKLDEQLGLYRRAPRTLITPVAFHSKKYYVLGKVMTKGVYTLDRPITVLEAIARAHGLENGLVNRNVIDLADFQRSFLMRGGKRYSLDFEKLFQQGDLSQNIAIEPGDYLYFPGETVHEVYVVGEVRLPGTVTYSPDLTIMAALSARGGYTDRAYKARVLVVRGSLNNPEAIAVDTHAILDGKALNFKLQPKDIIYVNSRPFIRVEELADLAATAFIQSIITEATGVSVVKPIQ